MSGRVVSVTGAPGDKVAVGSPLIVFELSEGANPAATVAATAALPAVASAAAPAVTVPAPTTASAVKATAPASTHAVKATAPTAAPAPVVRQGRVMTSPANRRRASEAGIDLTTVAGSGPGGRILRADLRTNAPRPAVSDAADTTETKVIGLRRLIAERMSEAKRNIPHFAMSKKSMSPSSNLCARI